MREEAAMPRSRTIQKANRTGTAAAPERLEELLEATQEFPPTAGDPLELARAREEYAAEAEPPGSMLPVAVAGPAAAVTGELGPALVFMDKLGERLAFERAGTRLYEALVSKFDTYGGFEGGPERQDLLDNLLDEHGHFRLVHDAIESLGGDPTMVTPSANLHAVIGKGLAAVLLDPRTSFGESLEAILVAELADNACWENLVELARACDREDLAGKFEEALGTEQRHLEEVRAWLAARQDACVSGILTAR
jgi:rubrerythrin